ncbi:MAG TPA: hypothetical protein VHB02_03680 [Acidimicrobiales bacterium]|nr:hypothetical protein [Acidimicrobiales bacterium]
MDDLTVVRRATAPEPEPDAVLLGRVRARLERAINEPPATGRRRPPRPFRSFRQLRPFRRLAWAGAALGLAAAAGAVALAVAATGTTAPPPATPAQHLALRLVDDQVQLVTTGQLSSLADVTAMACVSATACEAVGNATSGDRPVAAASTDGGRTWTEQALPAGMTALTALSCPVAGACWATGAGPGGPVVATTVAGGGWATEPVPAGVTSLASLSCPSATACWAVGAAGRGGAILDRTGGGWATEPVPAGVTSLTSVGCTTGTSPTACLAVGRAGTAPVALSTDGATGWTSVVVPDGAVSLAAAACPDRGGGCTVLAGYGGYWGEVQRYLGWGGSVPWAGPTPLPAGETVAAGTVMAGNGTCIALGGPSCTPQDAAEVNTVEQVVSGLEGRQGPPAGTAQTLTSAYVSSSITEGPSPVWYLGVSGRGLAAFRVLTPAQRMGGLGT